MHFSTKVFLTTSALSTASVLLASGLTLKAVQRLYVEQYQIEYHQKLELLAGAFRDMEEAYDQVTLNAARIIDSKLGAKPNSAQLARLTEELGVSSISIANSTGAIIASSQEHPLSNLFSVCGEYRELVQGHTEPRHTPLIPDVTHPSSAARFTLVPTRDGKRIIDIGMRFDELSKQFERAVEDDSDIVRVFLRSPDGEILGDVKNESMKGKNVSQVKVTVPANESDSCEYKARKLVNGSTPYMYEFVAEVSENSLREIIQKLEIRLAELAAVLVGIALVLSFWVSRVLVRKIGRIRNGVDRIAASGDYTGTLSVSENVARHDELDALAAHFNHFFSSMRTAQAEQARAAIAAQVAHDIRSPLTAMTLALNQLQERLRQVGAQAATTEMVSALSHGISRVNGIVKRLSKISDKKAPEVAPVEEPRLTLVDKIFFDVAQEHALRLPASKKFAIRGFEPVPHVWAVAQVAELQSALSNLLNNAFEAVGAQGEVVLSAAVEGRNFKTSIQDNGVGIPPENLAKVFEREFTSGKAGGSGLGLYQAKKAVEWCGGKISIESKVGAGTTVSFTIPMERTPSWTTDQVQVAPGQTLVAADDDPAILAAWRKKAEEAHVLFREFETIRALEEALPSLGALENLVFVLDQYAGDGRGGLTGTVFIEKYPIAARAYLSTSEFDDPTIQDRIKALKAKLIPKPRLPAVKL